ncbi:hypothetical protein LguiB_018600 [Lonicera macranthoides]
MNGGEEGGLQQWMNITVGKREVAGRGVVWVEDRVRRDRKKKKKKKKSGSPNESNNLKVSNFGLSALPEQLNNGLLHMVCGTPAYTASKVVRRKGYDGTRADMWSCGVILFVFLVGSLLFNNSNLPNMYWKIYHREFNMPDWISKLTQNLIYRLLNPNPVTRMSIEEMMSNN